MDLKSTAFQDGGMLPRDYTCDGDGGSPRLEWSGVPEEAKSLVLICEDPDAPGGTFHHWGVFNIPPDRDSLEAGFTPGAHEEFDSARNDFGEDGFGPACPPPGDEPHDYHFRLWALDCERLDFEEKPTVEQVKAAARGHVVAKADLDGWYRR